MDEYHTFQNSPKLYKWLAMNLQEFGYQFIAWTDNEGTQFDILFTKLGHPLSMMGPVQGGMKWNDLFVSIMRLGSFGFTVEKKPQTHPGYYEEKLAVGHTLGSTAKKLATLINGVRDQLARIQEEER